MKQRSTILVIEDNEHQREMLQDYLSIDGFNVLTAEDGYVGLEMAREHMPDIVLLDIMMPGMDGYETCKELRADPLLGEVPIIMFSALEDRDSRLRGIEAGADDFIGKTFDRIELRARLRTITRLNRYRILIGERARFEWVVQQSDDGYIVLDKNDVIQYANSQARLFLGVSPEEREPFSVDFKELVRRQEYQLEPEEAWSKKSGYASGQARRYLVRPDSPTSRANWLQVDVLEDSRGVSSENWTMRLRDVTDQLALQQDMRSFHAMVSHKLRTPLIAMVSTMELMANYAPKMSTDEIVEFANMAFNGVRRLHNSIEDIIQFLDAPGLLQPGAEFQLGELEKIVANISRELELTTVTVTGLQSLVDAVVPYSRAAIELILTELLQNSRKFHPINEPVVEVRLTPLNDGMLSIEVIDDGVTLSPEQLAHARTPYYQGEKYFTGEVVGMGLGLSIVNSLVLGAGGMCHIGNRKEGTGVAVAFVLPFKSQ